ncbi:hypothetical protein CASFOL_035789 [Castilleja foliolosa]|uniref:Phytocyanin domain-containing protein n=1 Tax=Castilleja foliolosa TaxID=1961234 RepID=A0ABD3BV70_9LAMI
MAQVRGSAHIAATAVIIMVTMSMLFQSQVAEAAAHDVKWDYGVKLSPVTYKTGDTINFKNTDKLGHNVIKVGQAAFGKCSGQGGAAKQGPVKLESGANFFICSVGKHCSQGGMKIQITGN